MNILMGLLERRVFAFCKKSKNPKVQRLTRPLSLVGTIILLLGFLSLLILIIIPQLKDAGTLFFTKAPVYYQSAVEFIDSVILKLGLDLDTSALHNPQFDFAKLAEMVNKFFERSDTNALINTTMGVTASVVSGVVNLALGFVIAVYVLAQKEKIGEFTRRFFNALLPERVFSKGSKILSVASNSFSSFVAGQCTDALLLGTLCFIGMLILRLPYAAVVSVIIGVFAIIPVIGPIAGEVISCFIIFMDSPWKALFFLIFILLLQAVDNNFIYPKIVGKSVGLPGILVLISVIIGGNIGGILGVLMGVPTASAIYAIVTEWINSKNPEPAAVEEKAEENSVNK